MATPKSNAAEDEEDDYLTMTFDEPAPAKSETLTQKKKRQAREAEIKGRPKSKAELAAEEKAKREAALNDSKIDTSSKGFKMMAALGYKPGSALGATRETTNGEKDTRLLEPVGLEMKEGRSGIGADAEKKRKFREEVAAKEEDLKKRKVDEGDFRERQRLEREEKRMESQMYSAMKVCERLEEEDEVSQAATEDAPPKPAKTKPLSRINVLWRGLVKQRAMQEREKRMKYDFNQSLTRRNDYNDNDEDEDDKLAVGKTLEVEDPELDQDDEELEEFESLDISERLQKLVDYLRHQWHYCFWCKHRYPDASMEGCPGTTEEDHD
jgi:hypothetical protein